MQETAAGLATDRVHVNPIRSKTEFSAHKAARLRQGRSLEPSGNGRPRQMIIHDITRLIVPLTL